MSKRKFGQTQMGKQEQKQALVPMQVAVLGWKAFNDLKNKEKAAALLKKQQSASVKDQTDASDSQSAQKKQLANAGVAGL